MHVENNILYFDGETQDEIARILLQRGLLGERVLVTECGRNPHVFLEKKDEDRFLRSRNLDPERLRAVQKRPEKGYEIDPAKQNSPGSDEYGGPDIIDPLNILMYGRGGSTVRVTRRMNHQDYPINLPGAPSFKVIEKTCPDKWSARVEEEVMRELSERGRNIARIYRRAGDVLDIEMVSPTLYDLANTPGRSKREVIRLLEDAMMQKLLIYDDLPEILDKKTIAKTKQRRIAALKSSFPTIDDEDIEKDYDGLKLIKAIGLARQGHPIARQTGLAAEQFLQAYEQTYGWMLREERRVHARLLSDEYTKNRGIKDGKTVAFDFSPKFDIPQIDDMFLLQAGGNNLDREIEKAFIEMSAHHQDREFWDYYATYVCATPTRSYIQMTYILDDLETLQSQLEDVAINGFRVSPYKDPLQYATEIAQVYQSRISSSFNELISYAKIAKEKAHMHGMQCYHGRQETATLRNAQTIHNISTCFLGERLEQSLNRQLNSPMFRGREDAMLLLKPQAQQVMATFQAQQF